MREEFRVSRHQVVGGDAFHVYVTTSGWYNYGYTEIDGLVAKELRIPVETYREKMRELGAVDSQCMTFYVHGNPEKAKKMAEEALDWVNSIAMMQTMRT